MGKRAVRSRFVFVAVWIAACALSSQARADESTEPHVVPTLTLGLGGFFPFTPRSDAHLVGSALLGLQARIGSNDGHRISVLGEVGYSGDRRGYLAGRHLVLGTGLRYGTHIGMAALLQVALGRTEGERSWAIRMGARFDLFNYVGAIVLYEGRHIATGPDADLVGRGIRVEVFFDPIRFARAILAIDRL